MHKKQTIKNVTKLLLIGISLLPFTSCSDKPESVEIPKIETEEQIDLGPLTMKEAKSPKYELYKTGYILFHNIGDNQKRVERIKLKKDGYTTEIKEIDFVDGSKLSKTSITDPKGKEVIYIFNEWDKNGVLVIRMKQSQDGPGFIYKAPII